MKTVPPSKILSINIHEFDLKIHFSSEFALLCVYKKNATTVQTTFIR